MRILHLIPSLGDGGAERQLSYLARALAQRGHEVHIGLLHGGPNSTQLADGSVRVHDLRAKWNHDPRLALEIWRLVRRVRPQVVQTWLTQMDVLGGAIVVADGIPWVLSERASEDCYPRSAKNIARRVVARHVSLIVANSDGGVEYWRFLPHRVRRAVVLNGLPLREIDDAAPMRTEDGAYLDQPFVLHVGRLAPQKNMKMLLRAFARTRQEVRLVLVGDGPERDELRELATRLGIAERVFAIAHMDRVWALMKRAAAVISVSHFEGQPNVLLEAMACRSPIIASKIPAHFEILDDESALMVDKESLSAISSAIDTVLGDPATALRRADVARARVLSRTFETCAEQYEQLYNSVIAAPPESVASVKQEETTVSAKSKASGSTDTASPFASRE